MRIIVCGGRDFNDIVAMNVIFDYILPKEVAHGAANGADTLADIICHERKIKVKKYPADWNKYGKAAGYIRNAEMLKDFNPDIVVCFRGGKGTAHMKNLAKKNNIHTIVID